MALLKTNTGIGTTNPTSALHVIGDVLVTGVVTATTFNGNINTGVATITTATITDLTNTRLTSGIGTINNLTSNFNNTGVGTINILNTGIGTINNLNNTLLNVSGIASIAALHSPSASINVGVITDLTNTRFTSGIATITNLDVTNSTFINLNADNAFIDVGIVTDITGTRLTYTGVGTITTLDTDTATINNLTSDYNNTGIGTISILNTGIGTINNLNNTLLNVSGIASIAELYSPIANINVGLITDITNTRFTSGIATITNLDVTNSTFINLNADNAFIDVGIVTNISGTYLNYTGIGTVTTLDSDTATLNNVISDYNNTGVGTIGILNSGIGTITNLNNAFLDVSGVGTIATLNSTQTNLTNLNVSGISTIADIRAQRVTVTGIVTANSFRPTSGFIQAADGTNSFFIYNTTGNVAFQGTIGVGQINNAGGYQVITFNHIDTRLTGNLNIAGVTTSSVFNGNINSLGVSTFRNGPVLVGTGNSTGTAFQPLQVTGSAFVSDNFGIGVTNPTSKLHIDGDELVTGVVTATTFNGQINAGVSTLGVATAINLTTQQLIVSGLSTFVGVTTFQNDVYINGDLYVTDDLVFDELTARNINVTGVATIFNLVSTASTITDLTNIRLTSGIATITNLNVTNSTFTNLNSTNLNAVTGVVTTISGTNVTYTNSDFINLNADNAFIDVGIVTDISGTRLTYTGVGTITTLDTDTATINNLTSDYINVGVATATILNSGIGTINNLNNTLLNVSGVATITTLNTTNVTSTNSDFTNLNANNAFIDVGIVTDISGTRLNYTGVGTIATLDTTNATIDYLTNTDLNVTGIATIQNLDVLGEFDVYDTTATFHNNVYIVGNLSIGGTSTAIVTQDLKVLDSDIILGVTTDAFGNDISNDTTANHGGIAVASTEGYPLVDLFIAGLETAPSTYKKIMWFKAGSFAGLGTDAWLINYAVGIGSTQVPNNVRLAVGNVQITDKQINADTLGVSRLTSGIATITGADISNLHSNNLFAQTGIITDLSGTRLNYTGFGTITNLYSADAYIDDIASNVGFITALTNERLNVTGVSTFAGLLDANGGATIDNIRIGIANDNTIDTSTGGLTLDSSSGTVTVDDNLAISGNNTLSFNSNSLNINHSGGNANIFNGAGDLILGADGNKSIRLERVGVATLARFTHAGSAELYFNGSKKFETNNLGIEVFGTIQSQQLNVSGIATITNLNVTNSTFTNLNTTNLNAVIGVVTTLSSTHSTLDNINSSGISTLNILRTNTINSTGVVTAPTFVGDLLGVANYAHVSGFSTFSGYANASGVSTFSGYANSAGVSTFSDYANNAGIATYAWTAGVSTYSGVSGFSTFSGYANAAGVSTFSGYANVAGVSTFSGYANAAGVSTFSDYANVSGIATYSWTAGVSTYSGVSGFSTFSGYADSAGVSTFSGYANAAGVSTFSGYADVSGVSTFSGYANAAGVSTFSDYANVSGIATYAWTAGVSTYSGISGFSTFSGYANAAGVSTFSDYSNVSGIATYAWTAGVSTYSGVSGFSTFSGYANAAGVSTFSGYANSAGVSTFSGYANAAGVSTFSDYANNAGIATYAWTAGVSTYSGVAGVSTSTIGGIVSVNELNVTGVSTLGEVQITSSGIITSSNPGVTTVVYYGDGSNLFGVTAFTVESQPFVTTPVYPTFASNAGVSSVGVASTQVAYIPNPGYLGIGLTTPQARLHVVGETILDKVTITTSGIVTSSNPGVTTVVYYGDGSNLFGVTAFTVEAQPISANPVYPTFASNIGVSSVGIASTLIAFIPTTGFLGIGITNPTQKLDVDGSIRIRNGLYDSTNSAGNSGYVLTSNGADIVWSAAGGIGIVTNAAGLNRQIQFNSLGIFSGANSVYYNPANDNLGINTSDPRSDLDVVGNSRFEEVYITGNVGVGTTSPAYKIDVVGDINITGDYKVNGNSVLDDALIYSIVFG